MRSLVAAFVGGVALLVSGGDALAWGPMGHAVVARIAARELTPAARGEVERLLGAPAGDRMAAVSSAPDWMGRALPATKPWHYVDIELGSRGYNAVRDCPAGDCIVAAIARQQAILRDPRAQPPDKALALIWLIHLIGDMHQPLHCADDHDRGGNEVTAWKGNRRTNLHSVWDHAPQELPGADEGAEAVAESLDRQIRPRQKTAWRQGTPAKWANESFAIARDRIYPAVLANRNDGEFAADPAIVRQQLEKAGVRLGRLLNLAFE